MNYPITQLYNCALFRKKKWHSDDFGIRSPVIQKTFWRKCAIVERVRQVEERGSKYTSSSREEGEIDAQMCPCGKHWRVELTQPENVK